MHTAEHGISTWTRQDRPKFLLTIFENDQTLVNHFWLRCFYILARTLVRSNYRSTPKVPGKCQISCSDTASIICVYKFYIIPKKLTKSIATNKNLMI